MPRKQWQKKGIEKDLTQPKYEGFYLFFFLKQRLRKKLYMIKETVYSKKKNLYKQIIALRRERTKHKTQAKITFMKT